ncbi:MAG: hypothetical protein FJ134_11145 [Deltaproteobacteria bacterium]|nr:hypothetical protein [Deltaproteobacteria bacterium]
MEKPRVKTRMESGRFLAQCRECGTWVEVPPQSVRTELFFEHLEAEFRCCGLNQIATFTTEKDYIDFH